MKTKSLDTPTIDETLTNLTTAIATQDMTADELAIAQSEAKQALLQWVLEVIGEDDTYEGHIMNWAIEHRNVLRAEQRAKLGGE